MILTKNIGTAPHTGGKVFTKDSEVAQTLLRWLKAVNAFRIGLATGLLFALVHAIQVAGRKDIPVLTRLESALNDLRFKHRIQALTPSGRVQLSTRASPTELG